MKLRRKEKAISQLTDIKATNEVLTTHESQLNTQFLQIVFICGLFHSFNYFVSSFDQRNFMINAFLIIRTANFARKLERSQLLDMKHELIK